MSKHKTLLGNKSDTTKHITVLRRYTGCKGGEGREGEIEEEGYISAGWELFSVFEREIWFLICASMLTDCEEEEKLDSRLNPIK